MAYLYPVPYGSLSSSFIPAGRLRNSPPGAALKARRRTYEMARRWPLSAGALAAARWPDELEKPDPGYGYRGLARRARFRAVGVGRVSRVSRFDAVGLDRVSHRAIRCRASAAPTLFFRRCGVGRVELCTPSLPAARRTPDPCFGAIPHPQFLRCNGRLVLRYALRCRHADRLYFRHHLEGLAGRAAERFRTLRQAPAVAA